LPYTWPEDAVLLPELPKVSGTGEKEHDATSKVKRAWFGSMREKLGIKPKETAANGRVTSKPTRMSKTPTKPTARNTKESFSMKEAEAGKKMGALDQLLKPHETRRGFKTDAQHEFNKGDAGYEQLLQVLKKNPETAKILRKHRGNIESVKIDRVEMEIPVGTTKYTIDINRPKLPWEKSRPSTAQSVGRVDSAQFSSRTGTAK
jgi:hypothetical protein